MKKFFSKKLIIGICTIIAIIAVATITYASMNNNTVSVSTDFVQRGKLISSVDVSGTIESVTETNVYSKETFVTKEIFITEGDIVKKGDILAVLDTDELEKNIDKAALSIQSTEKSISTEKDNIISNIENATNNLKSAELALQKQQLLYDTARKDYESGKNADFEKAKLVYDSTKRDYEGENSSEILNAKTSLDLAEQTLLRNKDTLDSTKILFDSGAVSKSDYDSAKTAYDTALINYDSAVAALDRINENLKKAYDQAAIDLRKITENIEDIYKRAEIDLQTAKANYDNANVALSQAQSKNTGINEISKESLEVDLANFNEKKANAVIVAPASGTITRVNLKVGQIPTGVIFTIEDMSNLVIKTYIKEFSLENVELGQNVIIKTDSTGEQEFSGIVSYIAPTSRKDTASSNNVEFETKVSIANATPNLRIGMNARMNIILDEKDDVFFVPYDYIVKKENGDSAIYIADENIVKELTVDMGLESDVYVEISGSGIYEGMRIVTTPNDVKPGDKISTQ